MIVHATFNTMSVVGNWLTVAVNKPTVQAMLIFSLSDTGKKKLG